MQVTIDELRHCLDQARDLSDHYKQNVLNGNAARRSTDELLRLVREYLQKQVTVYRVRRQQSSVSAFYMAKSDDSYSVYLTSGLTDEGDRFALTKELFHVVLDEVGCRNMNLYGHLEEVLASLPVRESKPQRSTISEQLAEVAAMQFLFPYSERLTFLANANGNPDFAAAATRFGIPQQLVEMYCSDDYMEFYGRF